MAEKKPAVAQAAPIKEPTAKTPIVKLPLFEKENYMWMIIGGVVIGIGMVVMSGGKNTNPDQFDYNVVYSFTRVTIAPILILLGLMVEVYAIFKRPKTQTQ